MGNGYIYGRKDRTIIPFVVSRKGEACWVFSLSTVDAH